jgi:hypothetical protein
MLNTKQQILNHWNALSLTSLFSTAWKWFQLFSTTWFEIRNEHCVLFNAIDHFMVTRIWAKLWQTQKCEVVFWVFRAVRVKYFIFRDISLRSLVKADVLEEHILTCWGTWSLYVTCLRYLSLLNTKCNVLGYWRHRSVCYSGLFTTSLVVATISFTMCYDPLTLRLGAFLVPLLWSFDLLGSGLWSLLWSLFCDWSFICCPWNSVLAPEKTPCRRVSFPMLTLLRIPTIRLLRNS